MLIITSDHHIQQVAGTVPWRQNMVNAVQRLQEWKSPEFWIRSFIQMDFQISDKKRTQAAATFIVFITGSDVVKPIIFGE